MITLLMRSLARRIHSTNNPIPSVDPIPSSSSSLDEFIKRENVTLFPPRPTATDLDPPLAQLPLKCIVFLLSSSPSHEEPILVVLRVEDRVSVRALARLLHRPRPHLALAPFQRLVELTGYPVGHVPPFGHVPRPIRTICDRRLVDGEISSAAAAGGATGGGKIVVFGNDHEYRMRGEDLVRACHDSQVADVAVVRSTSSDSDSDSDSARASTDDAPQSSSVPLPLPWTLPVPSSTATATSTGVEIEIRGIIAQKRKIANLLLFLNIVPLTTEGGGSTSGRRRRKNTPGRVWAHPEDPTKPCEVQLILGKTVERNVGRSQAAALFKSLKIGQRILVTGHPQPHLPFTKKKNSGSEGRGHVVDVVVHEIEILEEEEEKSGDTYDNSGDEEEEETSDSESDSDSEDDDGRKKKKEFKTKEKLDEATAALLSSTNYTTLPYFQLPPHTVITLVDTLEKVEYMKSVLLLPPPPPPPDDNNNSDDVLGSTTTPSPTSNTPKNSYKQQRRQARGDETTWKRPSLVVGMDAEWQPMKQRGAPPTPVSILQIGSATHVFLIDMLSICFNHTQQQQNGQGTSAMTPEQMALSDFLSSLLADARIVKVGFGLRYDFKRLIESYPWMPCFGGGVGGWGSDRTLSIRSHVDALVLSRCAGDGRLSYRHLGLNALCRLLLGKALDKSEQASEWGQRPLNEDQVRYASLDVACLVSIYHTIMAQRREFFAPFWTQQFEAGLTDIRALRPRVRFAYAEDAGAAGGAGMASSGVAVQYHYQEKQSERGVGPTSEVAVNLDAFMKCIGAPLGGKVAIVRLAASHWRGAVLVEPHRMPRFPRGSGLLEFADSVFFLFVNVPSKRYPNVFTVGTSTDVEEGGAADDEENRTKTTNKDACFMTWWPGKGQSIHNPVIKRLLPWYAARLGAATSTPDNNNTDTTTTTPTSSDVTILLFVRPHRDDYVCCGRLEEAAVEDLDGQLCVSWRLMDYSSLLHESPVFQSIIALQSNQTKLTK